MKALHWARDIRADHRGRSVDPAARHLLLLLATYSVEDGVAWPSTETIAQALGYSPRHTKRLIRQLVAGGLLNVQLRNRDTSVYRLQLGGAATAVEAPDLVPTSTDMVAPVTPDEMTIDALCARLWESMNAAGDVDYTRAYTVTVPGAVAKYDGLKGLGTGARLLNVVVSHAAMHYLGSIDDKPARIARDRRLAALRRDYGVEVLAAMQVAAQSATGDPMAYMTKVLRSGGVSK